MTIRFHGRNATKHLLVNELGEIENIIMYDPSEKYIPHLSAKTGKRLKVYQAKGNEKIGDIIDITQYKEVITT